MHQGLDDDDAAILNQHKKHSLYDHSNVIVVLNTPNDAMPSTKSATESTQVTENKPTTEHSKPYLETDL